MLPETFRLCLQRGRLQSQGTAIDWTRRQTLVVLMPVYRWQLMPVAGTAKGGSGDFLCGKCTGTQRGGQRYSSRTGAKSCR